ncbi:MAG TPA: hypothetical protein VJ801_04635 [Polyangia bacterium]|jgi:hypothetical protein|nr:hypothetical protein [Polyangia bacterium]
MSIEVERATVACNACGAQVTELRRGRCWACYMKWAEMRPVPRGAMCALCTDRRRENLRLVELCGRSVSLCHLCAARVHKLADVPLTLDELRRSLRRNRRKTERREGSLDRRVFPRERRVGDRRSPPQDPAREASAASEMLPDFSDLEIVVGDEDIEEIEQTLVREQPRK